MKKIVAVVAVAALGMGLAACEGPAENTMEDVGEQQAEVVNERAEALEDADVITDDQADAATEVAEERADAMEAVGDNIDEATEEPVVAE